MVKHRRTKSRKSQRGGGYSFGAAIAPEAPYAQEVIGGTPLTPDCLAASRPGMVGPLQGSGGLPGFDGGGNINLGSENIAKLAGGNNGSYSAIKQMAIPSMNGGRYTVDVGAGPITGSAGPVLGGYPVVSRIGCEGGLVNTSPPGSLPNPMPLQSGGVGGVDSAFYTAPTAGYANIPSKFVDSVGAPVLTQQPYDARMANPACIKTGGRRNKRKTKSKKSKRTSRKNRRSNKNRR